MKRICVVITARPSYSRIKSVLKALQPRSDVDLRIVVAASGLVRRFGQIVDEIRDEFCVEAEVPCVVEGDRTWESAVSTGLLTTQLATLFGNMEPDVVVTIADRHETLATAIAASYQNIPLCHIQGGEMSGSIDDKVRNAVTQLADIHCVATGYADENVAEMTGGFGNHGIGEHIQKTGCPGIDIAAEAKRKGPLAGKDFVVLQHPDTTSPLTPAEQFAPTVEALRPYADRVLWFWPGEDAGTEVMSKMLRMAGLHPVRNLPPVAFLRTLLGSKVLVGNSSVGIRECSFLGVPVVNIGDRQKGRERGPNVVDVGYHVDQILEAMKDQMGKEYPESTLYGDGKAGERIAEILVNGVKEAAA